MTLKIEQKLDGNTFTELEPRIFTTGAFLVPMEIVKNGGKRYVWVVDEIIDDTYNDSGIICSPILYASDKENLLE
ncbi:MAG: hypothetical protein J7J43_03405 [Thermosipho sp. (in: Bacteria)]|nr:hypothetical protein [Thermosipho sp. (in: thermotogales)]